MTYLKSITARLKLKGTGVRVNHPWIMLLNSKLLVHLTESCMVTSKRTLLSSRPFRFYHKRCMVVASSYLTMFD
jgi:hypothetical protein